MESICVVAILKNEELFLDEWLLYHRMIGVDHFYLYDDDPDFPLQAFLRPHREYVTITDWYGMDTFHEGRSNQVKAYKHAVTNYAKCYDWVAFIDGDEFIVLRENENIKDYLSKFKHVSSVSLNWHLFGHNGFFENPDGLITSSLTRRMQLPHFETKSFTRPSAISDIVTPHFCKLKHGLRVDGNGKFYTDKIYPGKTTKAHINHYNCRSFKNWMERPKRGCPASPRDNPQHAWRFNEEKCLEEFVVFIAKEANEQIDEYMLKYQHFLEEECGMIKR